MKLIRGAMENTEKLFLFTNIFCNDGLKATKFFLLKSYFHVIRDISF